VPKTRRDWIKQDLTRASGNLDWCMKHIRDAYDRIPEGMNDQLRNYLLELGKAVFTVQQTIDKLESEI